MLLADMPPMDEESLSHFGIKGMKWGVRKEDPPSGKKASAKKPAPKANNPYALSEHDKAVLKAGGVKASDAPAMHDKYGPGSLSKKTKPPGRLNDEQKDALKSLLVIGGVAAGAWYLYHRIGKSAENDYFNRINPFERVAGPTGDKSAFRKEWLKHADVAQSRGMGLSKAAVDKFSDEPTDLKAGAIFKRISTERETSIRPGGFYASYKDEDVDRYKAILPVYWKLWGKSDTSGHIVNLRAKTDVKAPSPKRTYEMFRNMLNDEVQAAPHLPRRKLRDYYPGGRGDGDDDTIARRIFPNFAGMWANEDHPGTRHFFSRLKDDGFNAVVDMNDAGAISSRPMRLIDGKMFEVAGHDSLSSQAIATAQERIQAIAHAIMALLSQRTMAGEDYLAHAGVKGMKWGVRKAKEQLSSDHRERNERIVKTAVAVGAVAVAAILLKRGGFKVSSPASKKIALGGAKMALKVIQKTGRAMATTSVKIATKAGPAAVKGTAKVGTLAGKGAYKGAIAGGKAAGRAIAQNGSKFYEKGIKKAALSTVKLGSHMSYKLIGKGTPAAKEVAKKSFNLSPTDLLLNVRADKWRGR